jgi:SAM-dependent methyltransferase
MKMNVKHPIPIGAFRRIDETPDAQFYAFPRFVTHLDDDALDAVTHLYRKCLPSGGNILDLMSSWVSHLPHEVKYSQVVGLGMNEQELQANRRLTAYVVHDLNIDPHLPFDNDSFDGAGICVSIDYLIHPVAVLRELARVMKPEAPLIVTFSDRCFPTKAIAMWHMLDNEGRLDLVEQYFQLADYWHAVEKLDFSPQLPDSDPLFAVIGYVSK